MGWLFRTALRFAPKAKLAARRRDLFLEKSLLLKERDRLKANPGDGNALAATYELEKPMNMQLDALNSEIERRRDVAARRKA